MSSSTDERKIPKIVLKLGGFKSETATSIDSSSIFSAKAAELAKEFYKIDGLGSNYISLPSILKKINQNAYKSLENVLEL